MLLTSSTAAFLSGTVAYLGIRVWYKRKLASSEKTSSQSTIADKLLIAFVVLGQIVLPLFAIFSPFFKRADYAVYPLATVVGAAVMVCGIWLFWRSHADLGKNWSVSLELESEHQLITSGVYKRIRHPMYASFFLMALAQLLLVHNWLAGPAALLAVGVLYCVRRPHEEAMLTQHFGSAYTRYAASTGGIFPRLREILSSCA
jgi:protein-S-isoprenylcysteine O-methyltransferase Ste14